MILSDDPHIPWELIKPFRADPSTGEIVAEDEFWGESFALTHWIRGRPPASQLSFRRVFAVVAGNPASVVAEDAARVARDIVSAAPIAPPLGVEPAPLLPSSRPPLQPLSTNEELALLRSLEALIGVRVRQLPARRSELRSAFEQGQFDLLHLVSHGAFGGTAGADASSVLLEDGVFTAAELSPRMAGPIRSCSPMIFFNTCHSGRIGFSLTRLGAWAAHLIHLGCGGFLGTLWPVTDLAALAFAQAFYDLMAKGMPIGEATRSARRRVRDLYPDDPTWLAYRCYADPIARIDRGAKEEPDGSTGVVSRV
jgi:hypothetical protein